MKTILKNETQVVLGNVRLSYAQLFEPRGFEGQEPKYSVSLIIDKNDKHTIKIIKEAMDNAFKLGQEQYGVKFKKESIRLPLRDGDTERPDDSAYQGAYFLNARSKNKPQVVGTTRDVNTGNPITLGSDDVYSGCYANVSVNFYPYNNVSKGIGVGLNNVQKVDDGEPLAGGTTASDDFDFEDVDPEDSFLF